MGVQILWILGEARSLRGIFCVVGGPDHLTLAELLPFVRAVIIGRVTLPPCSVRIVSWKVYRVPGKRFPTISRPGENKPFLRFTPCSQSLLGA